VEAEYEGSQPLTPKSAITHDPEPWNLFIYQGQFL